jgi:hypothetical protein
MLMLASDAKLLLREARIREADTSEDEAYLALSHMHRIFSEAGSRSGKKAAFPLAAPKLFFYLSNLERIPRGKMLKDLQRYADRLQAEDQEDDELKESATSELVLKPAALSDYNQSASQAKIVEI